MSHLSPISHYVFTLIPINTQLQLVYICQGKFWNQLQFSSALHLPRKTEPQPVTPSHMQVCHLNRIQGQPKTNNHYKTWKQLKANIPTVYYKHLSATLSPRKRSGYPQMRQQRSLISWGYGVQYTWEALVFPEHTLSGLQWSPHVYSVEGYTTICSHTPWAIVINYLGIWDQVRM